MPLAVLVATGVLYGSASIGPLTPVCRVGTPCDGPAKHATLTFTHGARSVVAKTDGAGRYRLRLMIGRWTVRASVGMSIRPSAVVVRAGSHRATFSIDTGIR
jgi:hypothetical protein